MILRTIVGLSLCCVLVCCDYGSKPKIIFKEAGPSREYRWIGYTNHYPKTIPRPPIIHQWNPYSDPIYTASWVSHKPKGHGNRGKHAPKGGHSKGHGKIPHGFGPPKPSSVSGGYLGDLHGDFSHGQDVGHGGGGGAYDGGHSDEFSKGHSGGGFSKGHGGGDFSKGHGGGFSGGHSADFSQGHSGGIGGGHSGGIGGGGHSGGIGGEGYSDDHSGSFSHERGNGGATGYTDFSSNSLGQYHGDSDEFVHTGIVESVDLVGAGHFNGDSNFGLSQTYQEPIQSYEEPVQTYQEPVQIYQEPIQTYQEPIQTYQEPIQTYPEPIQTYQEPIQTYQEPIQTYQEPIQTYQEPIQTYQEPIQTYQEPIQSYQEPIQTYQGPNSHFGQTTVQLGQGGQIFLDLDPRVPNIPDVLAYSGESDEHFRDIPVYEPVEPLVFNPQSDPLPLENEGGGNIFNNNQVF